jgi:hypothetical protein
MLQHSYPTAGFIEPCLPSPAKAPPTGTDWLHEIKHDGFRIVALRDAGGVRLYTPQRQRFQQTLSPDRGGGRGPALQKRQDDPTTH